MDAAVSQLWEPAPSPELHVGSQLLEAASGPKNQDAPGSQLPDANSGPEGQDAVGS
jgi:hypothetical protein